EPGEDPAREAAEAGGKHLVRGDPNSRRDAVGGETVRGAGDPARDPGAVTFEVAVAAIAQAGVVDVAKTEELAQVVARDEVSTQVPVDHAVQLAVLGVDAGVEDGNDNLPVAARRGPGSRDVHPVVVPLENALGVGDAT